MDVEAQPTDVAPQEGDAAPALTPRQRAYLLGGIAVFIVILVLAVLGVTALARNPDATETWRDIFIIIMAIESLFLGFVLILLLIQLARLIALIQNEVTPILDSTNETLNTVRGTTSFLSKNLVTPLIRVNSSLAGLRQAIKSIRSPRLK